MRILTAALIAGLMLTGCAYDRYGDGYGRGGYYDSDYRSGDGYRGYHGYGDRYGSPFDGAGARLLDPWLAETREGQKFVTDHYYMGFDGQLREEDAERANTFFRRWSDTNRDYRLTDDEIRTSLIHVRNGYGIGAF